MRIALVGGGTGGHFYPLMAIAEEITATDAPDNITEICYLGPEPYNQAELDRYNIKFIYVPAGKQRLYSSFKNITDIFKTAGGIIIAFIKLLLIYPDVIVSKGGYTSVPVVIAGWLLRIPIVVHESDSIPGRANKIGGRLADYIGIAQATAVSYFDQKKVALVGMPIRKVFFKSIDNPREKLGISSQKPIILVTGGSQGAQRINNFVLKSLPKLLENFTVVHQVGDANEKDVRETAVNLLSNTDLLSNYFVFGSLGQDKFASAIQASDLVISRAGSTTIFEIALSGKPSIIIPLPEDISRDQRQNAYGYASYGGATVLEEHNLSDDILVSEIYRILSDKNTYQEMASKARAFTNADGASKLASIIRTIGESHL